jgi:hypothetical protein
VTYITVLAKYLPGRTEENNKETSEQKSVCQEWNIELPKSETGALTSQPKYLYLNNDFTILDVT